MYTLSSPKESEETIFLQAIDQIYEINKNYSDSSVDESNEDFENGEIKINFDFIDFLDESLFKANKSNGKNSESNLFNSSVSSESTEFESFTASRSLSEKFLTESKGVKIKEHLAHKLNSNCKIDLEIKKLKDDFRSSYDFNDKFNKSKSLLTLRAFDNNQNNNINPYFNSNCAINHFNFNYKSAFQSPNQQNIKCSSFICMPTQARNTNLNSVYNNNFQLGFFQQTNMNNNNAKINIESSILGLNVNRRKNSYPIGSNH